MNMFIKKILFILSAGILILAGCGGEPVLNNSYGHFNSSDVGTILTTVLDGMNSMKMPAGGTSLPNYAPGGTAGPQRSGVATGFAGPSAKSARSSIFDSCTTRGGIHVDNDGDGVDQESSYRFNCRLSSDQTLVGTQVYRDLNDSLALPDGGYSLDFDFVYQEGPGVRKYSHKGAFRYIKDHSSSLYESRYKLGIDARGSTGTKNVTFESNWKYRITPVSATEQDVEITGFFGASGYSTETGDPFPRLDVGLQVESEDLGIGTCAPPGSGTGYNRGVIRLTDTRRNILSITFISSCGPEVAYNGRGLAF